MSNGVIEGFTRIGGTQNWGYHFGGPEQGLTFWDLHWGPLCRETTSCSTYMAISIIHHVGNAVLGLPDQVYTSSRGLVQGFELRVSVFVVVYLNGRQGWLGFGAV